MNGHLSSVQGENPEPAGTEPGLQAVWNFFRMKGPPMDAIQELAVQAVFATYPNPLRARLLALPQLIFDVARENQAIGPLQETLKGGQPSYLIAQSKSGSTLRIDQLKKQPDG